MLSLFILTGLLACGQGSNKATDSASAGDTSSTEPSNQPSSEPDDSPDTSEPQPESILTYQFAMESAADSSVVIDVEVPEGVTAMQFDVLGEKYMELQYIVDPNDTIVFNYVDWITTDERLLDATSTRTFQVSIPWPARMVDAPIEAGRWSLLMKTVDSDGYPEVYREVEGRVTMKRDDDFSQGRVRILAGKATGISDNAAYEAAISSSITHLRNVYAEWGIELDIRQEPIPIAPDLPITMPISTSLLSASTFSDDREILLLFANSVESDLIVDNAYVPGPLMPSHRSIVGVGWNAATGGDGQLDSTELDLLKEELVQGIGHYMGLRHVVDATGTSLDALSDTESCSDLTDCEAKLAANIMFPYPVCSTEGCIARIEITEQQKEQLQLFVGTD